MKHRQLLRELQLEGLSRIERCRTCPRFRQLRDDPSARQGCELPDVPTHCKHEVCKPLVGRYESALRISNCKIA